MSIPTGYAGPNYSLSTETVREGAVPLDIVSGGVEAQLRAGDEILKLLRDQSGPFQTFPGFHRWVCFLDVVVTVVDENGHGFLLLPTADPHTHAYTRAVTELLDGNWSIANHPVFINGLPQVGEQSLRSARDLPALLSGDPREIHSSYATCFVEPTTLPTNRAQAFFGPTITPLQTHPLANYLRKPASPPGWGTDDADVFENINRLASRLFQRREQIRSEEGNVLNAFFAVPITSFVLSLSGTNEVARPLNMGSFFVGLACPIDLDRPRLLQYVQAIRHLLLGLIGVSTQHYAAREVARQKERSNLSHEVKGLVQTIRSHEQYDSLPAPIRDSAELLNLQVLLYSTSTLLPSAEPSRVDLSELGAFARRVADRHLALRADEDRLLQQDLTREANDQVRTLLRRQILEAGREGLLANADVYVTSEVVFTSRWCDLLWAVLFCAMRQSLCHAAIFVARTLARERQLVGWAHREDVVAQGGVTITIANRCSHSFDPATTVENAQLDALAKKTTSCASGLTYSWKVLSQSDGSWVSLVTVTDPTAEVCQI